jgi:transposase
VSSIAAGGLTFLGLDVHRDTISVAVLGPGQQAPTVDRITHDEPSVRRLVAQFPDRRRLRACYEAGPTGYQLARLLTSLDVRCQVIAPTLIPVAPGDRVKTDRRDCRRLARLHRAGELVAIRIPTVAEEAVRDLCRARADLLADRTRARHRLSKFLLRHGQIWRGGSTAWTHAHQRWLLTRRFDDPALGATYGHYRAVLDARDAQLDAIEADLATWYGRPPFAEQVARLAAYRASPPWAR